MTRVPRGDHTGVARWVVRRGLTGGRRRTRGRSTGRRGGGDRSGIGAGRGRG